MAMTIPIVPDLSAGTLAEVADMNNLAACCTFLLNKPLARVHDAAGGQSIATSTARTNVQFNTVDLDTDGMYSSGSNAQLTIQTPGWYKVRWGVTMVGTILAAAGSVQSTTGPNNPNGAGQQSALFWPGYAGAQTGALANAMGGSGLWPFYLWAGDYLQVGCSATGSGNTTGTTDAGSFFALEYVSIQTV